MLHIAIDGRLLAYTPAGISQYTRQLVEHLGPLKDPDETISVLHSARHPAPTFSQAGLGYQSLLTPPHHRWEQMTLPLELLRYRPQVMHSPDFIPPFRGPWRRVITVHDLAFLLYPETVTRASRAYYGQVKKAVKMADAVIAVSEHTGQDIQHMLDPDPRTLHVIPNGVDPSLHPIVDPDVVERWRARYGITRPYILFAGTFEPRKNLPTLVDAFVEVRHEMDVQLVLVGKRGWLYEPTFERIQASGVSEHIQILENLPREEYAVAYTAASVAVTPSLYEGFGLPVLEAMACDAPVIASNASALPEVVGDAGILFPPDDTQALARAILSVLTNSELANRLRQAGRERLTHFSWAEAAARTLALYRQVAS